MKLQGVDQPLARQARRGRKTLRGIALRLLALALVWLGIVAVALLAVAWRSAGDAAGEGNQKAATDPAVDSAADGDGDGDSASPELPLARLLDRLEYAVVKLESTGSANLGSGFVIDSSGLVATSYHVIGEATEARVRFKDGTACTVAGYAAVHPESDLAVLQLAAPPPHLEVLQLRHHDDPLRLAPVLAVGHPHGLEFSPFDGKVSRVVRTSRLPGHLRRRLRQLMAGQVDHHWIQHTARISEGNSGGPLLNQQGQVVGINTWVDKQTGFGYALHAEHLHQLRSRLLPEIVPLERYAKKEARVAALLGRLSAQRIEHLYQEAVGMDWRPVSEIDYESLQQLAWAVTAARMPDKLAAPGGLDPRQREELAWAADQVVKRLEQQDWEAPQRLAAINRYAARHVSQPMAGVFCFGTIERVVQGDDQARAALVRLAGTQHMLLLPLDDTPLDLPPQTACLVLGINDDGQVVHYGENPLKLTPAQVIAIGSLLPLGNLALPEQLELPRTQGKPFRKVPRGL